MKTHFLCKFNIQPQLDKLKYGRKIQSNEILKTLNSKCPNISKILPYGLALTLTCSPSTNVILINSYSGTPCMSPVVERLVSRESFRWSNQNMFWLRLDYIRYSYTMHILLCQSQLYVTIIWKNTKCQQIFFKSYKSIKPCKQY